MPYRQRKPQRMILVAQSSGESGSLAAPLREVVHGLDADLPIYNVRTMEELYRMRATSIFNVLITIVAAMGIMGLGLSIVGLYGLVAYAATRRTREIGIRMAIGATRTTVLGMVLRQGLLLALVGVVGGRYRHRTVAECGVPERRQSPGHHGARAGRADCARRDDPCGLHSCATRVAHQPDGGASVRVGVVVSGQWPVGRPS